MSKELIYIRFLQFSVLALTFIFAFSIRLAIKGNISLHKKINFFLLIITSTAVVGLLITLLLGFDYKSMKTAEALLNIGPASMQMRLNIHRVFSSPLIICLIGAVITGLKNQRSMHKIITKAAIFFWMGTLITALLFF